MSGQKAIPDIGNIRELPVFATQVIPEDWEDQNGHVNVSFYIELYNQSGWPMLNLIGIDSRYFREQQMGIVDLENHIHYFNELHIGERVSVYCRYLAFDEKRVQGIIFIVNESTSKLACSLEFLAISMDLNKRRVTNFPEDIATNLSRITREHEQLSWSVSTKLSLNQR